MPQKGNGGRAETNISEVVSHAERLESAGGTQGASRRDSLVESAPVLLTR